MARHLRRTSRRPSGHQVSVSRHPQTLIQRQLRASSLHQADPDDVTTVWAIVLEIGEQERHFNKIQNEYRRLASTWLLAAFAAVGFVLSVPDLEVPLDRRLLVAAIGAAATVGVLLLWVLDQLVYQRLLSACFAQGLDLEDRFEFLPTMRGAMRAAGGGDRGVGPRVVLYYLGGILAMMLVSATSSAWWAFEQSAILAGLLLVAWLAAAGFVIVRIRAEGSTIEPNTHPNA